MDGTGKLSNKIALIPPLTPFHRVERFLRRPRRDSKREQANCVNTAGRCKINVLERAQWSTGKHPQDRRCA
jgi:hypothetical protein